MSVLRWSQVYICNWFKSDLEVVSKDLLYKWHQSPSHNLLPIVFWWVCGGEGVEWEHEHCLCINYINMYCQIAKAWSPKDALKSNSPWTSDLYSIIRAAGWCTIRFRLLMLNIQCNHWFTIDPVFFSEIYSQYLILAACIEGIINSGLHIWGEIKPKQTRPDCQWRINAFRCRPCISMSLCTIETCKKESLQKGRTGLFIG